MKLLVIGLAALLVMMSVVPMLDSSFAESVPLPDGEDGDHDEKTCPYSGKKMSVNALPNS